MTGSQKSFWNILAIPACLKRGNSKLLCYAFYCFYCFVGYLDNALLSCPIFAVKKPRPLRGISKWRRMGMKKSVNNHNLDTCPLLIQNTMIVLSLRVNKYQDWVQLNQKVFGINGL